MGAVGKGTLEDTGSRGSRHVSCYSLANMSPSFLPVFICSLCAWIRIDQKGQHLWSLASQKCLSLTLMFLLFKKKKKNVHKSAGMQVVRLHEDDSVPYLGPNFVGGEKVGVGTSLEYVSWVPCMGSLTSTTRKRREPEFKILFSQAVSSKMFCWTWFLMWKLDRAVVLFRLNKPTVSWRLECFLSLISFGSESFPCCWDIF